MYHQTHKLTPRDSQRIYRRTRCLSESDKRSIRKYRAKLRRWRRSYRVTWELRRRRLSPGIRATLARLRGCETRGIAYPSNYRWDGHHKGAYQYTVSTWQRAEAWYGTARRLRRWSAHFASPAHQDVVTAYFYPSHASEWACSA